MELTAPGDAAILQTEQRNIEGTLEGVLRQLGDRRRRGCRQCALHKPDRLAGERRKPSHKAWVLEPPHRRGESFAIPIGKRHGR